MALVRVKMLGGFAAYDSHGAPIRLPTKKCWALLALLILRRSPPTREQLVDLLWRDSDEAAGRQSLRQALYYLRRAFVDGQTPATRGLGAGDWLPDGLIDLDALAFEAALRDGSLSALLQASELYQGELLQGLEIDEPGWDSWLQAERARLSVLAIGGLSDLLTRAGEVPADRMIMAANRGIELDPYNEVFHRRLLELYDRHGQRRAGASHYRNLRALLREDLDVDVEDETRALAERLFGDSSVAGASRDSVAARRVEADRLKLEHFAFALEQLPGAVVVTDLESRIIGWNAEMADALGYAKAEVYGKLPTVLHDLRTERSRPLRITREALQSGAWHGPIDLVGRRGKVVWDHRVVLPLRDEVGRPIGTFSIDDRASA